MRIQMYLNKSVAYGSFERIRRVNGCCLSWYNSQIWQIFLESLHNEWCKTEFGVINVQELCGFKYD